ncbi:choloylglycine hydrolase [uncultured Bifidobacterium sp.]|uniref:choloylglycine hydrolase n=1 Tax=uncultured Bifidobacterium sp. TaxID=165187 RepID=UPI002584DF16|nr:choloylglycine hydrolase [uncultured Bifidobacterium sp.]
MCTGVRFADEDGNMYFGRNLDWSFSYGEKIVVTPRGYQAPVAFNATVANPKPVMGVGIIVEGMPMYFDCANDEGLAVAGLNFPGYAQYADAPVDGTVNVAAYELPFWIARSFSTVDQVEEALKNVTVVAKQVNEQYPVSLLHWIVGDGKRSIVIEVMADGIHVHHDGVDVLANQPTFDWHTENLRNYLSMDPRVPEPVKWGTQELSAWGSGSGMRGIPGDYSSPSRFVRAAYTNAHYPAQKTEEANVSRLFHTLDSAAMVDGCALMSNGQYEKTIYTSGFSTKTNTYYKNTYEDPAIKSYRMADFDLEGSELQTAE